MNTLVTGATGLVGLAVVQELTARGDRVRALVRNVERAKQLLPEGVELLLGDITDPASVERACEGQKLAFHAAGMPEQWQRDDDIFDRINRQGTATMMLAALKARVERVVYTSTMDVFAAPPGGTLVETNVDTAPKPTAYERSKVAAEREADAAMKQGLSVVFVNPAAVYGPSPLDTALNGFFVRLLNGKVPMVPPGGLPLAFVEGVARAHVAAAEHGKSGERYLVGDERVSMQQLATLALDAEGHGRKAPPTAPYALMNLVARASAPMAKLFNRPPLIARGELQFLSWNVAVDSTKAQRQLGFVPTSAREGIAKMVASLKARGVGTR